MKTIRLSKVATIKMGQSPPGETYNRNGDGMPFFQGKADFGDIYPTVRYWCSAPKTKAEPNDILMSVRAPVGSINLNRIKSSYGRGLAAIRPTDSIDLKYLYHFLNHHEPKLAELGRGSTFEAVNRDDVEDIEIPFPSLPEQKRIAAVLDKADRLRRQRRYAQTLSDSFLQSVFIKMFGDPIFNSRNWDVGALDDLCSLVIDCPHSTPVYAETVTPFACVRTSDIQNGSIDWRSTKFVDEDEYNTRRARYTPIVGDVVYSREGARFGYAAQIPKGPNVCLGQRMMLLKAQSKVSNNEFISALMNSRLIFQQAENMVNGSASPHVNVGDIRAFRAILPPLPLQEKFARVVQKFERIRRHGREATRQAEHLFQTLLHRAFRGEL
ncbi:restriction endonuclease subunit S [soil metagenome]